MAHTDQKTPLMLKRALENVQKARDDLVDGADSLRNSAKSLALDDLYKLKRALDESHPIICELINASQPMNKLPPEVLCDIFFRVPSRLKWYPGSYPICKSQPTFMQNTKHYRPLLLTCRYWHRLIMNTSACWSTLEDLPRPGYFYSLPLFVNYVGRCAEGPLCIVVPAPSTSEMCELCRDPNISARVKQIVLTGNWSGSNQECCNDILFSSYPSLDTFALYQHRVGDNSIPRIRRILPDSSRLRQLWLSDVDFIPTTAFPALEAFSINSLHIDPGFERSLWILLCSSPRLKAIELRIIMKLADGSILAQCSQTKVSFNALRALTLELRPKSWDGASTMPLLRCEGLVTLPHLFNITVIAHTVHLMAYESPRVFERVLCFELVVSITTEDDRKHGFDALRDVIPAHDAARALVQDHPPEFPSPAILCLGRTRFCDSLRFYPMLHAMRRLHRVGGGATWVLLQPSSIIQLALPCLAILLITLRVPFDAQLHILTGMLDALMSSPDGNLPCTALNKLIFDCSWVPIGGHQELLSHKVRELASTRASLGHPIDRVFYAFIGRDSTDTGNRELCLNQYDTTASLVSTAYGQAARDAVEQEWEAGRN